MQKASKRKKNKGQDGAIASKKAEKNPNKPTIMAQISETKIPCLKYGQDFFSIKTYPHLK